MGVVPKVHNATSHATHSPTGYFVSGCRPIKWQKQTPLQVNLQGVIFTILHGLYQSQLRWLSQSISLTDLQMLFRVLPRRVPSHERCHGLHQDLILLLSRVYEASRYISSTILSTI